jgi:hypothetical protein
LHAAADEQGGKQAEGGYKTRQDPGAFLEHIGGLLDTHELVAETGDITRQSAPFGVLNQHNKTQQYGSQDDEYQE